MRRVSVALMQTQGESTWILRKWTSKTPAAGAWCIQKEAAGFSGAVVRIARNILSVIGDAAAASQSQSV